MLLATYREKNLDLWAMARKRHNKTYYEKNKVRLQTHYRNKAAYDRESKLFRGILLVK